jgi:hypothetical protein
LNVILAVYTGTGFPLTEVACANALGAVSSPESVSVTGTAGTTYYIRVNGIQGSTGAITLTVAPPPANDNLAAALQITATGTGTGVTGTTLGATAEPNETVPTTCNISGTATNSIWWKYTPSVGGTATFSTSGSTTSTTPPGVYDTVLSIYTQTGTSTGHPLTEVACSDDVTADLTSFIGNQTVTAGTTYFIRAAGHLARTGTILLTVTGPAPLVTVSQTLSNGAAYRLLSAPVTGMTVGTLAEINLVQGVIGQYPGGTNGDVVSNVLLDFVGTGGLNDSGYLEATDVANPVVPGDGFFWYFYDIDLTPPSNEGNGGGTSRSYTLATRPLTASGTILTTNTSVTFPQNGDNRFHIAGNPFGQAMTADGVTGDVPLQNTIQVYNPASGFVPVPRTAETTLSTWQGFFIEQMTAGTAVTVTYDASKRVAGNVTIVGRSATDGELALALSGQTVEGTAVADQGAIVRVTDVATVGWDIDDATKLVPPMATYALLAPVGERDGAAYRQAVLSRPAGDLGNVTLAFTATHAGTYTITAEATDLATNAMVRDLVTGTVTPLVDGYTFTSDATEWTERFVVSFGRTTASDGEAIAEFALAAPAPNPTAGAAVVRFDVPEASAVSVSMYDLLGRQVAVLAQGEVAAGRHEARLEAGTLAPGVYVIRMQAGTFAATQRVTVVR